LITRGLKVAARAKSKIGANQEKQNFGAFNASSAEYRENNEIPLSQSHAHNRRAVVRAFSGGLPPAHSFLSAPGGAPA
jgi:hypothetical protein